MRPGDPRDRGGQAQPLLLVDGLAEFFPVRGGFGNRTPRDVHAVDDVSFAVLKGETLGVVGESGCGKSTLARPLMQLISRDRGSCVRRRSGRRARGLSLRELRRQHCRSCFRTAMRRSILRCRSRSSSPTGRASTGRSGAAAASSRTICCAASGCAPTCSARRYPHRAFGRPEAAGQCRSRARASPRLLILDEAVSALDKSVEAQVLNLLRYLKRTSTSLICLSRTISKSCNTSRIACWSCISVRSSRSVRPRRSTRPSIPIRRRCSRPSSARTRPSASRRRR